MRFFKRKLKPEDFTDEWKGLMKYCQARKTWPKALEEADKLLDKALKRRGFRGKTTGERLVAAQKEFNFNEAVWFSHKYCNRLKDEDLDVRTLKKKDVLQALAGFREALRDLGALSKDNA